MTKTLSPSLNSNLLRASEVQEPNSAVPALVSGVACVSFSFVLLSDVWLLLVSSVNVSVERTITKKNKEKPCESY